MCKKSLCLLILLLVVASLCTAVYKRFVASSLHVIETLDFTSSSLKQQIKRPSPESPIPVLDHPCAIRFDFCVFLGTRHDAVHACTGPVLGMFQAARSPSERFALNHRPNITQKRNRPVLGLLHWSPPTQPRHSARVLGRFGDVRANEVGRFSCSHPLVPKTLHVYTIHHGKMDSRNPPDRPRYTNIAPRLTQTAPVSFPT